MTHVGELVAHFGSKNQFSDTRVSCPLTSQISGFLPKTDVRFKLITILL